MTPLEKMWNDLRDQGMHCIRMTDKNLAINIFDNGFNWTIYLVNTVNQRVDYISSVAKHKPDLLVQCLMGDILRQQLGFDLFGAHPWQWGYYDVIRHPTLQG